MLRRDKRSLILCLVLGDGCLHYFKRPNKLYGGLTIAHGVDQADYLAWKASLVSQIVGRNIKIRKTEKTSVLQFAVCWPRLRAWRKFCYPGDVKNRVRILNFIHHPQLAMAIWLCDDGSCHKRGNQLAIHSNASSIDENMQIIEWADRNFKVSFRLKFQRKASSGAVYPFIKLTQSDSLILWAQVREFILQFKSMQLKFRTIEHLYQQRLLQPQPPPESGEDIVHATG